MNDYEIFPVLTTHILAARMKPDISKFLKIGDGYVIADFPFNIHITKIVQVHIT